jgi:hypothetical protein
MEIRPEPPDTHMITQPDLETREPFGKALYVRVRVQHKHGKAAENVELLAAALRRLDTATNEWEVVSDFIPLSLTWSHVGGATIRVPRQLFRLCDLGHLGPIGGNQAWFVLNTIVQPNQVGKGGYPNLLFPGTYEIELILSGDNVETISGRWRIAFGSEWTDDQATMLQRVQITPV